jgi:hypothetical protein
VFLTTILKANMEVGVWAQRCLLSDSPLIIPQRHMQQFLNEPRTWVTVSCFCEYKIPSSDKPPFTRPTLERKPPPPFTPSLNQRVPFMVTSTCHSTWASQQPTRLSLRCFAASRHSLLSCQGDRTFSPRGDLILFLFQRRLPASHDVLYHPRLPRGRVEEVWSGLVEIDKACTNPQTQSIGAGTCKRCHCDSHVRCQRRSISCCHCWYEEARGDWLQASTAQWSLFGERTLVPSTTQKHAEEQEDRR